MFSHRLQPEELHEAYAGGIPFPNLVIDDFLEREVADRLAEELETADFSHFHQDNLPDQVEKRWMNDPAYVSTRAAEALRYFNSDEALGFFSLLTGIPGLIADPTYTGGGVHVSGRGARLSIHADFNVHPATQLHRRVNALLYLNRDWKSEWNGQLELWPADLSGPAQVIEPIHNRLVVFSITDTAFHGVARTMVSPPERKRLSLALYYYTEDRPEEEKAPFHWAMWQHPAIAP